MNVKRKSDYEGLRAKSIIPLSNSLGCVPIGTTFIVENWSRGLELRSESCNCCGFSFRVSRVSEDSIELIDDWYNRSRLAWNKKRKYVRGTYGRYWQNPEEPCPNYK